MLLLRRFGAGLCRDPARFTRLARQALDAVISSKVRQLVVLKRDLERFNCEALELRGSRRRTKP